MVAAVGCARCINIVMLAMVGYAAPATEPPRYDILIDADALRKRVRMEESTFDLLLRQAAQRGTRRAAVGALIGGALVLASRGESEATERAKRRRKRKRQQRRRQAAATLRPFKVRVKNPGLTTLDLQFVSLSQVGFSPWRCFNPVEQKLLAGGETVFVTQEANGSSVPNGYLRINGTYYIEFWNLPLHTPAVSAAVNGVSIASHRKRKPCPARGTRAVNDTAVDEGRSFTFRIYDKTFTVFRAADTNYKEFTLTLPTNL